MKQKVKTKVRCILVKIPGKRGYYLKVLNTISNPLTRLYDGQHLGDTLELALELVDLMKKQGCDFELLETLVPGNTVTLTAGSLAGDNGIRQHRVIDVVGDLVTLETGPKVHISWCIKV